MADGKNYSDALSANARQVGGAHYAKPIQHWDYVVAQGLGYFEGQITKYVSRWRDKNGLEDLKKARHFLDKLIEIEELKEVEKSCVMERMASMTQDVGVEGTSVVYGWTDAPHARPGWWSRFFSGLAAK